MKGKLLLTVPLSPFCLSGPAARAILLKHKSSEASLFKTLYWLPPHSEERPKSLQNGLHCCAPPHSHRLSSAALSPRPHGDRLATVTSSSLTHAKHAPTSALGTCSSLRLLLTLSFLSSLRSKVITVEAFSDHCALCVYFPRPTFFSHLRLLQVLHSTYNRVTMIHSHIYFLFASTPPEYLLHEGRALSALFTAVSPAPRTDTGAPWLFVEPWFNSSFITELICDLISWLLL